jgi:DNA primase
MYSRGQVVEFLEKVFGEGKPSNGGLNYSVLCPNINCPSKLKNKRKFVIQTQSFVCHCWVCGLKSKNIGNILKKYYPAALVEFKKTFLEDKELEYEDEEIPDDIRKELTLPFGYTFLMDVQSERARDINAAFAYLRNRGLTERDFWYYKFGIVRQDDDYKNRIIMPSFDSTGKLNFFTTRTFQKTGSKGPKYVHCSVEKTSIIFNEINIDWTEELTIVEGPFDMVKCNDNSTCMLGCELDEKHALFAKIVDNNTPVLLAFDNDAISKMYKTAWLLVQYGIDVRIFMLPEGVHDVGEMRREEFISLLPHAKMFNGDDYLKYRIALL